MEEIIECCKWAKQKNLPVFVLGGGSNVLISDKGFDGLVIKLQITRLRQDFGGQAKFRIITVEAGVSLAKIVDAAAKAGLTGLEWAVGIPGTIGGAICGNAGAYGKSTSDLISRVRTLSLNDCKIKEYLKKDCGFVYRGSCFKKANEVIIVVEVEFPSGREVDQKEIENILLQRKTKIPILPSPGSFFKNYKVRKNINDDPLIKKFPELTQKTRGGKIGVGYLIEQCGLKGKKIGGAMVADEHANFIVNTGGATAKDVMALAALIKERVRSRYGFNLEEEVCMAGF